MKKKHKREVCSFQVDCRGPSNRNVPEIKHCWRGEQALIVWDLQDFWPAVRTLVNKINLERDVIY